MTKPGLAAFEKKLTYDKEILKVRNAKKLFIPPDIKEAFMKDKVVWNNFIGLAPSYKKQYVWWIAAAKKIETKERRLKEALILLKQNKKLGMK